MRESRPPRPLVFRAHVEPDVRRHDRRRMVLVQNHLQPVGQSVFFEGIGGMFGAAPTRFAENNNAANTLFFNKFMVLPFEIGLSTVHKSIPRKRHYIGSRPQGNPLWIPFRRTAKLPRSRLRLSKTRHFLTPSDSPRVNQRDFAGLRGFRLIRPGPGTARLAAGGRACRRPGSPIGLVGRYAKNRRRAARHSPAGF